MLVGLCFRDTLQYLDYTILLLLTLISRPIQEDNVEDALDEGISTKDSRMDLSCLLR